MNQQPASRRTNDFLSLLFIVLLCALTRLPQLLSANMILDSDECIVALMAKHMCQGKDFAVFFYGQSYGFSLVETAVISLFSIPTGITDISVKLAMLALWTTGVIFFYKSLKTIIARHNWLPLFATVLLILCPAWAVWSMKARGGYLTAFLCCSVIIWLLQRKTNLNYLIAGMLLVVVWYSQPLWLPGLLPFFLYSFLQQKKHRAWLSFIGGIVPALTIFLLLKHNAVNYWKPVVFDFAWPSVKSIDHAFSLVIDHFNAWYYLEDVYPSSFPARISAGLMIAAMIMVVAAAVFFILKDFRKNLLFILSVVSIMLTLFYALFLTTDAPRYLLPLSGFLLFSLALLLEKINEQPVLLSVSAPLVITGILALYSFRSYAFVPFTKSQLYTSIHYLEQHNIHYVFSNDGLLEWQIMYYSNERIICRESSKKDRLPAYVELVNNAYRTAPQTTAVIDFYGDLPDMAPDKVVMTGGKFAVVLQPDEQLLRDMEFEF